MGRPPVLRWSPSPSAPAPGPCRHRRRPSTTRAGGKPDTPRDGEWRESVRERQESERATVRLRRPDQPPAWSGDEQCPFRGPPGRAADGARDCAIGGASSAKLRPAGPGRRRGRVRRPRPCASTHARHLHTCTYGCYPVERAFVSSHVSTTPARCLRNMLKPARRAPRRRPAGPRWRGPGTEAGEVALAAAPSRPPPPPTSAARRPPAHGRGTRGDA